VALSGCSLYAAIDSIYFALAGGDTVVCDIDRAVAIDRDRRRKFRSSVTSVLLGIFAESNFGRARRLRGPVEDARPFVVKSTTYRSPSGLNAMGHDIGESTHHEPSAHGGR